MLTADIKLLGPIDLIKKSINIFFDKKNFTFFLKIYAWLIPFQFFFMYQDYFINAQAKILNTNNVQQIVFKYPLFLAAIVIVNLLFMLVSFWIEVAGIKAIGHVVANKTTTLKEVFSESWKILWLFSLLSILLGLIELGGFILLIIPGVIFSIWYGFSKFIFINDGVGVVDSLKISKKLVEGRFWKVFGRIVVFVIFTVISQAVFTLLPYGIGSIFAQLFGILFVLPYFLLYKELNG